VRPRLNLLRIRVSPGRSVKKDCAVSVESKFEDYRGRPEGARSRGLFREGGRMGRNVW
jgi:hypothetical protein